MMTTSVATSHSTQQAARMMERPWIRGVVLTVTIGTAMWLGVSASQQFLDARAEPAGCVTLATSTSAAVVTMCILMVLLTALGMIAGKLVNAVVGVFVLGTGLAALSLRSAAVSGAFFEDASFVSIAVESMIWSIPTAIAVVTIFRFAGSPPDIETRRPGESWWLEYFDPEALRAGLVAIVVPIVVWCVVRNMLKGQAFGGACLGGVVVGIAYRMMAPRVQPIVAFVAPILAIGLSQFVTAMRLSGDLGVAFAANALPPQMRLMPMDVVAGSLTGVAIGIGWARSFAKSDTHQS
ncbi:MAG: hypothetical protein EXS15_01855 [Phycisphaerales bacterium]|nr:hypothetical protein [Phycisphaerales bacterium]